ncbi:flagellar hook-basal body complex protein [Helicobacter ibis]|uniref:Flagellar hook-basal body complex protein n=1 Tax=Helicobacter ibis TaxID=2962633 RepID=A0ABT4VEW2_9HELI|nr:flagellar hook-basal body complex protein [Helicobacter ibis]MDA3968718.1 flagellar hook-basal body complex protein [Helicobacter ibis]
MIGSLYSGISGIKTHQFGIDVTSNNIANVNTTGFRANSPEFKSLFATSLDYINANSPISNDYNYGTTVGANPINSNDGSYVSADGQFNVAYSGKGWFVVGTNKNGTFDVKNQNYQNQQNYFTRDGSFSLDAEGYLVNSSGLYMYGINLGKIGEDGALTGTNNPAQDYAGLAGSNLEPLRIPKDLYYRPTLTTEVDLAVNLNRTKNPKPITSAFKDKDGNFDMQKFRDSDFGIFMDGSGKPIDAKNFKDIKISIEQDGKVTTHEFIYGDTGENGFKTVGELIDKIKEKTGLDVGLKLNDEGNPVDCSLYITNNSMQDMEIDISGKLADKLGISAKDKDLNSSFANSIESFGEGKEYKDGEYVKYNGMIFQKNGDGVSTGNPLEDEGGWSLVDSSAVPNYDKDKEYKENDLIVIDGTIYKRTAAELGVDEEGNPLPPNEDAQGWEAVGESVRGEIPAYEEGKSYDENSYVLHNGVLYKKINGAGSTNPSEDKNGWRAINGNSISSTSLNVPSYTSNTEIFSDTGEKFILKNEFVLVEQGDKEAVPPIPERWEVKTAIYDMEGKVMISDEVHTSEITFDAEGRPTAPAFDIPFLEGTINVDLTQADGKPTTNHAYTDSAIKAEWQDGTEAGLMKDIIINDDGVIIVNFTNGKNEPIGRFGLAAFVNDQGLSKVGGNLFEMNVTIRNGQTIVVSGPPLMAWNENGYANLKYGKVMDHMLETSNVDTGTALTDLIIYQRGYQMSSKAISTADQLMQEAIGLKK